MATMEIEPGFEAEAQEVDALTHLEERIQKTVALVARLRHENETMAAELAATRASLATAQTSLADAKSALGDAQSGQSSLGKELADLRAEKQQVRNRLEKLLGHIDQLGAA